MKTKGIKYNSIKPIKKIVLFLSLLFFSSGGLFAQSSVWKVEKNNTSIYLGGTVHILRAQDYPLPEEFEMAFSKSDILVLEANVKEMQDSAVQAAMMKKMMYELGDNLSSHLSESVYEKLKTESELIGIPIEVFNQFKPSMVSITLTTIKMQQMGISIEGVDQYFYNKAEKDGKSLLFLETVQQQINMLSEMGQGNEDEFILKTLEDLSEMESELNDLLIDWKEGSDKMMIEQLSKMKKDYPDVYQSLLVDRNNAWISTIEGFFENEKVECILVGALHLQGKDGVLNQLKKRGYSVNQLVH